MSDKHEGEKILRKLLSGDAIKVTTFNHKATPIPMAYPPPASPPRPERTVNILKDDIRHQAMQSAPPRPDIEEALKRLDTLTWMPETNLPAAIEGIRSDVESAFNSLRSELSLARESALELARLRESSLSPQEARYLLGQSVHFGKEIYAKLRLISESP